MAAAPKQILFVADEVPTTSDRQAIGDEFSGAGAVHVIAPVLGGRLERATDSDEPAKRAGDRLDSTVASLRDIVADAEVTVTGEVVTDPPFEAIEQLLRTRSFDRVVLGIRSDEHWKERDLAARLRDLTEIPIVEITLESS